MMRSTLISCEAQWSLSQCAWKKDPNVAQRAVILSDGDTFTLDESWLRPREKSDGQRLSRTGILAEEKKEFAARESHCDLGDICDVDSHARLLLFYC